MRLHSGISALSRILWFLLAGAALHGQVLVSLGTGSGCNALQGGQTCTLTARVTGATILSVNFTFVPSVAGATIGTPSGPDSTGLTTITYKAPNFITSRQTVTATATSVADPTQFATAPISLVPPTVTIAVTPTTVTLNGGQAQQFTATVNGISQTGVTWSINPQVGTIDPASGLYTAPAAVTASQKVTVIATSTFDPAATGSATVTLQPPPAISVTVSPTTITLQNNQIQQFTATVQNSTLGVIWSLSAQLGSVDNTGLYTAPATISSSQKLTVTATSVEDPTKSASATITLNPAAAATVTVSPASVTLTNNQTQQFSAVVANLSPTSVTWSISPQMGSIDPASGLYTAPGLITGTQKITVTATSIADQTKTGTATITLATLVDVGIGAPANLIQQFVNAYYRNGFNVLVALPPLANVKKLGTTGYVQEFSDANKTSGVKLALVTVSPTVPPSSDGSVNLVVQLLANLYAYYTSVTVTTAGYPLMDTQNCPPFDPANNCTWDLFDKGYALFTYALPLATGQNFTIRQAFYTEWSNLGGISGPGRPIDVETAITAATGTTATVQTYAFGAAYTITSGINKGKTFGVSEPMWDLYVSQGGPAGSLGLPTGERYLASTNVYRQTFEGGALQINGSGDPTVQLPVNAVGISGGPSGNAATLNLGQTLTVTAVPTDSSGTALTDRPVSWSTTNSKVISIQATGQSAVLSAVGGGTAAITASSGGVTSVRLSFTVIAPCCQIGAGAPVSVQQSFQDAITRDKLSVQLPAASPAVRVANGYVQILQAADPNVPAIYMVAKSDQSGTAWVVAGALLTAYQTLNGPAGALGYPAGDANPGGTQLFTNNAALAGNPVRMVSGGILSKWALQGYDGGAAGLPTSDSAPFSTFGANSGASQSFANGDIYAADQGPRAGSAYYVTGLILSRFNALGGAGADYGMPTSDEFVTGSLHQQNFEGGTFTYATGDSAAVEHLAPKVPGVIVAPASVSAGSRARLAIVGFPNNSTVRVSVTGLPDFLVTSANGAYSWDMSIPLSSKSGTLAIHAVDTKGPSVADGSLVIRGFTDNRLPIVKVQGDNQTGLPGAALPLSLRIALKDPSGSPVVGASVVFQASPGAQISATSAVTDSSGVAETSLRLPASEGIVAVTADAPALAQAPVSFYARSAASTLANFPQLVAAGSVPLGRGTATLSQKGALLTAVAAILRYRQNRGELPAPNGFADPAVLNQFLTNYCVVDANANQLCDGFLSNPDSGEQIVNLWRAADFTGGVDIAVSAPTLQNVGDLLAQGYPVLLSLGLFNNGTLAGGHYVVATGVSADGSIVIQDPNPYFGRVALKDYLNGFTVAGSAWKADLRGVVHFLFQTPAATRFMLGALSQSQSLMSSLALGIQSAAGDCGVSVDLLDAVDSAGNGAGGLVSRIQVCDGSQAVYQLTIGATQAFRAFVTDLAPAGTAVDVSGSVPAAYKVSRPKLALALSPQDVSFTADTVVNAASFTTGIAPGGLMAISGTGLASPGGTTVVDFDGEPAAVVAATPFRITAIVPSDLVPGLHALHVQSAYGSAQVLVSVLAVAPAIFVLGNPPAGAVINPDGSLNGASNPLTRGKVLTIYATGLGTVAKSGQVFVTTTPVSVLLNGEEIAANFAGSAPGYPGEYQVNVTIPATIPPGLGVSLTLKQGGQVSNAVLVALQ